MPSDDSHRSLRITIALCLGSFIVFCNLYSVQAILPQLSFHFEISETKVNWLFAATTLGLSVSLVPWAVYSDKCGRKPIIISSLFLIPATSFVMLFCTSFESLVLVRGLLGIALAAFAGVAVAYLVEELSSPRFASAMGFYIAANSLGGISGRVLGGVINQHLGWQATIITLVSLSLVGAIAVYLLLPNQHNFKAQGISLQHLNRGVRYHINDNTVWFGMLIGGLNFALFVNLYSVVVFRLAHAPFNLDSSISSLFFLCYLAGTLSSSYSGYWSKHRSPVLGMMLGGTFGLLGMLTASSSSILMIVAGLLLISFGGFFTHSLAYAWVNQQAKQQKTSAGALYLVHYYVGGSLGGFVLLFCWQQYHWQGVIIGGSCMYALLFTLAWKLHLRENSQANTKLAKPLT
ncbi:MFS transporter [Alginatibacterium sediminis]|uniref:MFS transporter n=1 Tax=Alginatibacterium sediminis TaxID=2164068 RepID=A0A420EL15_9ALTE|nr:MFS transporter [Alginatibacterium sediminis]RKF21388.1 MFS transporter [Alginatibacterium sediminis]